LMVLIGPVMSPSPQLKLPTDATMCFRSGEKTGGLQAISVLQPSMIGARCVICLGVPPLMLAQICGVCLLSYCFQAKAWGGGGTCVRVAGGMGWGVVPGCTLGV